MKLRVIVVAKRSAYTKFVEEDQDPRARELIERSDPSVRRWKKAHQDHVRTLDLVGETLEALNAEATFFHGPQTEFDSSAADLIVTVGGDGTLLAASHNVHKVPVLGVNSAPDHSIGFFCAARAQNLDALIRQAAEGRLQSTELARMEVTVAGRCVAKRVLNEALFCHGIPAATSRYILRYAGKSEEQRSSGLWVGTAAGSTGALRSAGGKILPLKSKALQLIVREPYQGEDRPYSMQKVLVEQGKSISLRNKMQDAWLFLDGPFRKVSVALGEQVKFKQSQHPLNVLGIAQKRRQR